MPWPHARLTLPTWERSRPFVAASVSRDPLVVGEVERADLDAHRDGRPVDDRAHELVPVARQRRELGDLVEERELVDGEARRPGVPGARSASRGRCVSLPSPDHARCQTAAGSGSVTVVGRSAEQRIGPRPGRAVVLADRAVAGGLHAQRQPEDLDEPDGGGVVERVALVVGREALVVQRQRRAAPDDHGLAVIEPDPDLARHDALRRGDVAAQVARQGAEPQAVVDQPGQLVGHEPVEAERVARQRQALEGAMGGVQDRGRRRLVDLAALDADEAVLDVVDAPDAVRAAERVEPVRPARPRPAAHRRARPGCRPRTR